MIVIIDNYDSFTFNIVQVLGGLGVRDVEVIRNDVISAQALLARQPDGLILSPGPCTPLEAGISNDLVRASTGRVPILGICLGHQCIATASGVPVARAPQLMHGKTSIVHHDGQSLFVDLPNPFEAARYHSLTVPQVPEGFEQTAWLDDGTIMGIRRVSQSNGDAMVEGIQFHPESFMTPVGARILSRFVDACDTMRGQVRPVTGPGPSIETRISRPSA